MRSRILSWALVLSSGLTFFSSAENLEHGDEAWERRHIGAEGRRAAPEAIGEAVKAYEKALTGEPENLEIRWKLLRALQFQGGYSTDDRDLKQRIFARGRQVSEETFDLLARRVGGREALDKLKPEDLRDIFPEPEVPRIYYWATANWGEWGRVYGKMAAARQGVAGKVRDYIQAVIALDPECEDGGGYRVHSRLHAEAPRIPFVTGWIDRDIALRDIHRAFEISPDHPYNRLYLADALLRFEEERKGEALEILRDLISREPRPDFFVDDAAALQDARELYEKYR